MINTIDMSVQLADYGLKSLKKYCKLFEQYNSLNSYSAPETWTNQKLEETVTADIYSFGMILWELETGNQPFTGKTKQEISHMLVDQQLRPMIPETTDKNLQILIRRCWNAAPDRRPQDFTTIIKFMLD
jgi:serine/threonine protein kinase